MRSKKRGLDVSVALYMGFCDRFQLNIDTELGPIFEIGSRVKPPFRLVDLIDHGQNNRYWKSNTSFTNIILPLLACAEIKDLVLEAFYTRNYFVLAYSWLVWGDGARKVMLVPP